MLRSQACLITNRTTLHGNAERLASVKTLLELIEARRRSRQFVQIVANVPGASIEDIGQRIARRPELAGMQGPAIAPVWSSQPNEHTWYTVTIVVPQERMLALVEHLRSLGGGGMAVFPAQYVFEATSTAYERLLAELT
jgi:ATP phosphoribosyltransferase